MVPIKRKAPPPRPRRRSAEATVESRRRRRDRRRRARRRRRGGRDRSPSAPAAPRLPGRRGDDAVDKLKDELRRRRDAAGDRRPRGERRRSARVAAEAAPPPPKPVHRRAPDRCTTTPSSRSPSGRAWRCRAASCGRARGAAATEPLAAPRERRIDAAKRVTSPRRTRREFGASAGDPRGRLKFGGNAWFARSKRASARVKLKNDRRGG